MAIYDITTQTIDPSQLVPGDIINCPYSGLVQSITLLPGVFQLECWGAQGGYYSTSYQNTGKGGYSIGTILITNETTLFLYTGQYPAGNKTASFGGGGSRGSYGGVGGGASDIRIGTDSLYARVIVAGGAGGAGYRSSAQASGCGGGLTGGTGAIGSASQAGGGGTQTSGGTSGNNVGTFGQGGNASAGGAGGGGWYGGGSGMSAGTDSAGGGGSGYVYTEATASNYPEGCLLNSAYYLTDASTVDGATTITLPDGSTAVGNPSHGYIRITYIRTIGSCPIFPSITHGKYVGDTSGEPGEAVNGQLIPDTGYSFNPTYGATVSITDDTGDITASAYNPSDQTISLILNSPVHIIASAVTITIGYTLTKCTSSNTQTLIVPGTSYTTVLTPEGEASLDIPTANIQVLMGGVDITSIAYNSTTHTITIASITSDIQIIAYASGSSVSISTTNCTCSQSSGIYAYDSRFQATVVPSSGYKILQAYNPPTIIMGGVDITSSVYDYTNYTIDIPHLTADVSIVLVAQITSVTLQTNNYSQVAFYPNLTSNSINEPYEVNFYFTDSTTIDYNMSYIRMDGVDITDTALDKVNNKISIASTGFSLIIYIAGKTKSSASLTLNLASISNNHFSDFNKYMIKAVNNSDSSPYMCKYELVGLSIPQLEGESVFNYDGLEKTPIIKNYDTSICSISGIQSAIIPGNYTITITRPSSYFWKSDNALERIKNSYNFNWSIIKNNRTISSDLTNNLVFDADHPIVIGELVSPLKGNEVISIQSSEAGTISGYLSGHHIVIESLQSSTGTISIQLLENEYYNASNILTYTYTSTVSEV